MADERRHEPRAAGSGSGCPCGSPTSRSGLREYQLLADGRRVGLTVREFQTFLVLAQRPDRVVTRPEIYALVWGGQMTYRDRSVDVFVRKVRRKLAPVGARLDVHPHALRGRLPVLAGARDGRLTARRRR